MHAASPTEPSFTSRPTSKQDITGKIDRVKHGPTLRQRLPSPPPLPSDLPPELAAQVITITSPRDLLAAHTYLSDRRLRLLVRRYTNQIQYGCKNINCAVPTCLSYRRRKARAPLRKYTDTSARALACHLIDEYGEKALCGNEPVVPWFEEPGSRQRRTSSDAKVNGKSDSTARVPMNGHANGRLRKFEGKADHAMNSSTTSNSSHRSCSNTRDEKAKGIAPQEQPATKITPVSQSSPPLVKDEQPAKKDPKSFVQALLDSFGLQSLWSWTSIVPVKSDERESPESTHLEQPNGDVVRSEVAQSPEGLQGNINMLHQSDLSNRRLQRSCSVSSYFEKPQINHRPIRPVLRVSGDQPGSLRYNGHSDPGREQNSEHILDVSETPERVTEQPTFWPMRIAPLLSVKVFEYLFERSRWEAQNSSSTSDQQLETSDDVAFSRFAMCSTFYSFCDPHRLLASVRDWHRNGIFLDKNYPDGSQLLDENTMLGYLMVLLNTVPKDNIFKGFHLTLAKAYVPPSGLQTIRSFRRKRKSLFPDGLQNENLENNVSVDERPLEDDEVASICATGLYMLIYEISRLQGLYSAEQSTIPWTEFICINQFARVFPEDFLERRREQMVDENGYSYRVGVDYLMRLTDIFDDRDAQRLFDKIADVIGMRLAFFEILKTRRNGLHEKLSQEKRPKNVASGVALHLIGPANSDQQKVIAVNNISYIVEWAKILFLRTWDGKAVVRRAGPLGGALQLLAALFKHSRRLGLSPMAFYMAFLTDRLDMMEMPVEWLSFRADNKRFHLLSFAFLFEPKTLVAYFRAINFSIMSKSTSDARGFQSDVRMFGSGDLVPVYGTAAMMSSLRPHMANSFVLTVRRDNVLEDAINQVWRRQKREIMRPLKVRMGMEEGEQGVDIGGVQQEFFRVFFAQALDPAYGMFTIDGRTQMTWFQPGSLEPLYKFEVLGIFMSIAVYNSITLPITFPLAFYRKLLSLDVKKLHHIKDGWPDLANGLKQMLDWSEGDVGDVFIRTYEFSYEAFGTHVDIDMKKLDRDDPWPPLERKKGKEKAKTASFHLTPSAEPSHREQDSLLDLSRTSSVDIKGTSTPVSVKTDMLDSEAPTVTNVDRDQYVKDYIFWLTEKSIKAQYKAFAKGFYTCLDRTALSIFTPEALKTVIEGYSDVDIEGLKAAAKYEDGFDRYSSTIQAFWNVVDSYSPEQHRQLLEFVTASDRVPVNGIRSVQFIVQKNGTGDERLPTSMTCFGRLLLPEYTSQKVLEEKLTKAIENAKGFGVA